MRLIGMLDSPYVRRVAIAFEEMGLAFEHSSISVFREFDAFSRINPVVKAPSLVSDEGVVLMDSTLILQHAERMAPERSLVPADLRAALVATRLTGLALAACEKTVQLVYERELRPAEKRHAPWTERVEGQLRQAYDLLQAEAPDGPLWLPDGRPTEAAITTAVACSFTQHMLPELAAAELWPQLAALAAEFEQRRSFRAWPIG